MYNTTYAFPTATLFEKSNILHIKNLYTFWLLAWFMQEIKNNMQPLRNISVLTPRTSAYCTAVPEFWKINTGRSYYGTEMFKYILPKLLNHLIIQEIDVITATAGDRRAINLYFFLHMQFSSVTCGTFSFRIFCYKICLYQNRFVIANFCTYFPLFHFMILYLHGMC